MTAGNISARLAMKLVQRVALLKPPMIQEKPEVVKVTCGDLVSLECRVAGTPQIHVRWTKDGIELHSSRKHHLCYENNLSSLHIQSSQLEDSGEYLFEATNSVGSCSCKVMLVVLAIELLCSFNSNYVLISKLTNIQACTATFIAKIGGDPIPSVKWMKGKWRQITPGGRISIEQKGQNAKLEIREVTKSDSGNYRCVATNKHGEIECTQLSFTSQAKVCTCYQTDEVSRVDVSAFYSSYNNMLYLVLSQKLS
uniref:Ig-like domain-containing protein n=1 Tax=Seriola dumerili TaxID=41447 RepID=A0A3B4THW6_SERDU